MTGLGVASAFGTGNLDTLRGGAPLPLPIASFDASKYPTPPIVEVPAFDPAKTMGEKGLRSLDRLTKLLIVSARLALQDAALKKDGQWIALSPERVGVCASNAYGSLEAITELDRVAVLEDARYINPSKFPNTVSNSASGYVSIWEDLRALNVSVSNGNCGGLDAIACAELLLANGRADAILTGGGEAMSEALYLAFDKLGVLTEKSRLGEGAAFLVLEPLEKATSRAARILGTVRGYGTAYVAPKDDVTLLFGSDEALERAINSAFTDAGVASSDVDLVVSGLSGVERFDREERAAIERTLPGTPISAPKTLFGETLGAGGALGMAASLAFLDGTAPSAIVHGTPGPRIERVLVTALGYYGNASAVLLQRS